MKVASIRDVIRRSFEQASGLADPATLVDVTDTNYVPGFAPSRNATNWPVKMIHGKAIGSLSRLEAGPVLNEQDVNVGWLYSPDVTPAVGDEIHQEGAVATITKIAPLDQGAGVLFEVWLQ